MELLPSMIGPGGKRLRGIYNRVHWRDATETFHEFLIYIVKLTLGKEWAEKQLTLPHDRLPAVFQWLREWADLTARNMETADCDEAGAYVSDATVGTKAVLQLGYDLFCLQAKDRLPEFLVEKLRRRETFQSARHEVAVAALMTRSGFEIEFLDDQGVAEKHCEFIATHIDTGERVGVEAKSRHRAGVLHEKGERAAFENDADGLRNLIRKAKKQKPEGLPLLIFVDLNLSDEDAHFTEGSPLVESVFEMVRQEHCSEDRPAPYAAIILTSFVDHHAALNAAATKATVHMVVPMFTEQPVSRGLLNRVVKVSTRYDRIPDDI